MDRKGLTSRKAARRRGFTLIEVMIVILIVLALGGLVAWNLMGAKEDADANIVRIQMNTFKDALRQFRFDHSRYPTDEEGLAVLWDKEKMTDEDGAKKWKKLIEKPVPKDKWGNEWGYRQVSEHGDPDTYDLWSYGKDRQEGTDDDIVSWETEETDGTGSGGGASTTTPSTTGG